MDDLQDLLGKKAFSQDDLLELRTRLALMPAETRYQIEGDVYEALELIITDYDYEGDVELVDLEGLTD